MKKLNSFLIFLLSISVFQSCTEGETKKEILKVESKDILSIPMKYSRGFLIFNQKKYPAVKKWEVLINSQTTKKDIRVKPEVKLKIEKEKNYLRIPQKYLQRKSRYSLILNGLNKSGVTILQSNIFYPNNDPVVQMHCPGCGVEFKCSWKCVGPNYAYNIRAFKKLVGDEYYLELVGASNYDENEDTSTPYYYYSYQSPYGGSTTDGFSVIGPINTSQTPGQYCTATGSHISGLVYGIAKDLGPWEGSHLMTEFILGHAPCLDGVNAAIMVFNNAANGANFNERPNLSCGNTPCSESGGNGNSNGSGGTSPNPCSGISLISGMSFYNDLAASLGCLIRKWDPETKDSENSEILRSIQNLEIRNLTTADKVEKLNTGNFIDEKGNVKREQKIVESGLYLIGVYLKSGEYIYTINEVK